MSTKETAFTSRDMELLANALKCSKTNIVVDYELFAKACGFKNANSAKAGWHNIKKKLDNMKTSEAAATPPVDESEPGDAVASPPKKKPNAAKKRKAATEEVQNGEGSIALAGPATKKGRKPRAPVKGKKAAVAAADGSDEEEIDTEKIKEASDAED